MFIARWTVIAKFGHKDTTQALCRKWSKEIGDSVGLKVTRVQAVAIGASESRLEIEHELTALSDLEKAWSAMAKLPQHQQFAKDLEPHIVSGSNQWEVLRVVDG